MIRVAYLIRSLEAGGAERQLAQLAGALDPASFATRVITFYPGGDLEEEIKAAKVSLTSLDKRGRWDLLGFLLRLRRAVADFKPDILHAYLSTANLMSLTTGARRAGAKIVWGKRASELDTSNYDWATGLSERLEMTLARKPDLIVANSAAGRAHCIAKGAAEATTIVIGNGTDLARFQPMAEARAALRREWGLAEEVPLIGIVARLDPMKGHPAFLRAAALALRERPELRFVAVGGGPEAVVDRLQAEARDLGLAEAVLWAGKRQDIPRVLNALDLHCSASLFGEGFSNATAEAMAVGVPCVVTDVGDSAAIVGATGSVVPPDDPQAMAKAWLEILGSDARSGPAARERCRQRVAEQFSMEAMVARTEAAYRNLMDGQRAAMPPPGQAR